MAYTLELSNSTAQLRCSCCTMGMTSVCGFISQNERPYSVYYALLHNTLKDIFVRLSVSVGDWWRHDTYKDRYAVCLDVTPGKKNWRISVLEPIYSPQQNFAKFGQWLSRDADSHSPPLRELLEVADFILTHDPALLTYLTGRRPDYSGRTVIRISKN